MAEAAAARSMKAGGFLLGLALTTTANASNTNGGLVTNVWGTHSGAVLFDTSGTRGGTIPACGAPNPQRFGIDASTVAGQAAVALLMSAQARGKRVWVEGKGTCLGIWNDTEEISHFLVEP
jgi:hypothetical protein